MQSFYELKIDLSRAMSPGFRSNFLTLDNSGVQLETSPEQNKKTVFTKLGLWEEGIYLQQCFSSS
jgi:hypothetical protein